MKEGEQLMITIPIASQNTEIEVNFGVTAEG